jgi:hypothetical protein
MNFPVNTLDLLVGLCHVVLVIAVASGTFSTFILVYLAEVSESSRNQLAVLYYRSVISKELAICGLPFCNFL